jgi:hypothetical protein
MGARKSIGVWNYYKFALNYFYQLRKCIPMDCMPNRVLYYMCVWHVCVAYGVHACVRACVRVCVRARACVDAIFKSMR